MPYYRFLARTEDRQTENLGIMELRHDGDALSFAGGVIRDLMHADPAVYSGWTLDISEDDRAVATLAFASTSEHQLGQA